MGSRYLTDLASVCVAAGLVTHEQAGWQTRGRSTGGYGVDAPNHVMVHHTASPPHTDGQADVNYIVSGSPVKPVANLYLSRKGEVWVCAAGATNTNGAGSAPWAGGMVPDNRMNEYAIGIEAANNGTGEPWPEVQQDAYVRLVAALCNHYRIPVGFVRGHCEWAPARKIDPAGPSRWAASGTWNMAAFRSSVATVLEPVAPPTPPPIIVPQGAPEMFIFVVTNAPGSSVAETWTLCDGTQLSHIVDGNAADVFVAAKVPVVRSANAGQTAGVIKSCRTMNACPPEWVGTGWEATWNASRG